MVDVLRRRGDRTDILARLPEVRGVEHVAAVSVLFNPADTSLPWKSGDILIARNQGRYPYGRSVIRLRRGYIGRIESWSSETIWSESASALSLRPLQGLALDPVGALYFSEQSSRNIFRLHRSPRGTWTAGAVASVPSNVPFGGDFALAADGKLYVSSGAGVVPGLVYKSNIRFGDPPPLNPTINTVAWGGLYRFDEQGGGAIEGFGFYDPDQLVFADGTDAFWQKKVNPRFDPAAPAPPIVPTLPTFPPPPPTLVRHDPGASGVIHSTGPLVTAWTDYLDEHPEAREAIRWQVPGSAGPPRPYSDWDERAVTGVFRRVLHRFYGAAAAGESGPLSYKREIDPLTGEPRVAPGSTPISTANDQRRFVDRHDAWELMLAYLGVQLWVETSRLTGHRIANFSYAALDPTESLFQIYTPNDERGPGYVFSESFIADVTPDDPVPALNLMLENNLFGETPEDTVYRIGNWMRAKLHHGPPSWPGWELESYGYDGLPPLTSIVERRVNPGADDGRALHWAWRGCHTAAGAYVLLARLANVPGDTPPLWENWVSSTNKGQEHRGVRFESLKLRALHADDFYAMTSLKDPRVTADRVFNVGNYDFEEIEALAPSTVTTQTECDVAMSHYHRLVSEIGVSAASILYLDVFWAKDLILDQRWPSLGLSCEDAWGRTPPAIAEATQSRSGGLAWPLTEPIHDWARRIFCEYHQEFLDAVTSFLGDNNAVLPPGDFEDLGRQNAARDLYLQQHQDWLAKRV